MSEEDLFAVKGGVGPDGANLEVRAGRSFPRFLARLCPRAAARRDATSLVATSVLRKIARGEADASDVAYAKDVFGEAEWKWIRRQQIAAKAMKVVETFPKQALPAIADATNGAPIADTARTAEDWINKFWDDAGLVSDEMLQQIYARLLAQESIAPESCSMRTLLTLRYLDHKTAHLFGALAPYVMACEWVPHDIALLKGMGVPYAHFLELDTAGLVDSKPIQTGIEVDRSFHRWGARILRLDNANGLTYPAFLLRQPGRELAKVAEVDRDPTYFFRVANWLKSKKPDVELTWAEVPFPMWEGATATLDWMPVPPGAPG